MKTTTAKSIKSPKERTSLFLDPGSLEEASNIASLQSAANPHRDEVTVSAVLREAIALALPQLRVRHADSKAPS
jgi:hypothetical protein